MKNVTLSLPTKYELDVQKGGIWSPNHFACYFYDKDCIDNAHNQFVFIRSDLPISLNYTELNDTRALKSYDKESFIGGIVPVIRNAEFIQNHFNGDHIIRYGRFPFGNVDEEERQMLEQKFLDGSLLFTDNFFINNPEFYIDGKSYVLVNKKMMPKYIKLGNNCNFNVNFQYGKDYAKYFEHMQNDYINNKDNYDWARVENIYWKYIRYKSNDINVETKLICNNVLARYNSCDNIMTNLLPFISTDLEYSDFLVEDKVAKYVSIDKYKKIGRINYKIADSIDDRVKRTDICNLLAYKNDCNTCYKIHGNLNLFKDKEYPQYIEEYDTLGLFCPSPTGKQYHLYVGGTIRTYNEYLNTNNGKKYIIIDDYYYQVTPMNYSSYNDGEDVKAVSTVSLLGGIPPEKIDEYLYTYFLNDIEPSIKYNQVMNIVNNNLGYRYLMNKNGLSENDLEVDDNNKLVLKPKQ